MRSTPKEKVLEAIQNATPAMEYRIRVLMSGFDMNSPEGRRDFLKEAVALVEGIESSIERDFYIGYLSRLTGTDREVISSEVVLGSHTKKDRYHKKANTYDTIDYKKASNVESENYLEKYLIRLMMDEPSSRERIIFKTSREDYQDENSKKIYDLFLSSSNLGIINTSGLMNNLDLDEKYVNSISKIVISGSEKISVIVDDYVDRFLKYRTEENIKSLLEKQKRLEDRRKTIEENTKEAKEVDLEIMNIALEIISENKKLKSF